MEQQSFRVMEEESGCNECLKLRCWCWARGDLVVVRSGKVGELGGLPRRKPGLKA